MEYYVGAVADFVSENTPKQDVMKTESVKDSSNRKRKSSQSKKKTNLEDEDQLSENNPTASNINGGNTRINVDETKSDVSHPSKKKKERKHNKYRTNLEDEDQLSENNPTASNINGGNTRINVDETKSDVSHPSKKKKERKHNKYRTNLEDDENNQVSENNLTASNMDEGNTIANVDETKSDVSHASKKKKEKKHKKNRKDNASTDNFEGQSEQEIFERESRTIFVGNLPATVKKQKLKKFFSKYGVIESFRLRCPPLADTREPKKVAIVKKHFHPERTNINAFIRFTTKEFAVKALEANGLLFGDHHHIRVDMSNKDEKVPYNSKKAVFLGNVPFGAEEEELRAAFNVCGEIDNIRIVRDHQTGLGKGFAYLNFKSEDATELALQMDGHTLKNRQLRVQRVNYKNKNKEKASTKPKSGNQTSTKSVIKLDANKKPISKNKKRKQLKSAKQKETIQALLINKKVSVDRPNKTVTL